MGVYIESRQLGAVLTIAINRPDKKNAITQDMYSAMADALEQAASNTSVKVIVLQSDNAHFTTGNDLNDFLAKPSIEQSSPTYRFLTQLMTCPIPVIAAVKGYAVGIGSTMLLHCEQVFVDSSAILSFPFINLGLVPEAGSSLLLPRLIGYQKAADLLLRGDNITAQEAVEMGLVSQLVDEAEDVNHVVKAYAELLSCKSRESLIAVKALLKCDDEPLAARSERELQKFVQCLDSPAAKEAMSAFLEKRKPDFTNL